MKAQNLQITYTFNEDRPCLDELIMSSFASFLHKELEKVALYGSNDV